MGLALVVPCLAAAIAAVLIVYMQGKARVQHGAQYVALGSSFSSGPGIPHQSAGSPLLCARSDHNYAHMLARKRGLTLVDVSCAGATTNDILKGGQYFQSPQVDAIGPSTTLVTITIGGNDVQYLSNLVAKSCSSDHSIVSFVLRACVITPTRLVDKHFGELGAHLRDIAKEIRARSQRAHIVFVGYLDVLPAEGSCESLGLSDKDIVQMRGIAKRLKEATRAAAIASSAAYVDPNDQTTDHSACSAQAWVNGRFPSARWTAPFHPNVEGMRAVALAIDASLGSGVSY